MVGERRDEDWKLNALNVASRSLSVLAVVWLFAFGWTVPFRLAFTVALVVPAAFGWFSYRVRSYWLTSVLLACCFSAAWLGGPTPGALLCGLSAIISAGIFLGVAPAVVTWVLTCVAFSGGLLLLHFRYATHFDPSAVDPRHLSVVVRFSSTYLILSFFLTQGVTFVVQRLARLLGESRNSLAEARAAQIAVESARDARQQALTSLVEAQRMGVMGKLSAQIAHDFNNSLQVVLAYGWHLENGDLTEEETKEGAREIVQICQEASQLSHQLLALGQKVTLETQPLQISDEVKPIHKSLQRIVPRNIELSFSDEASGAVIEGDVVRLRQAIYNLCINAIHAMPDGGRLELNLLKEQERVVVEVTDTGVGIEEETRKKIFEPFFTTKGEGGTGLGLVAVKEIMEEFHGGVSVESKAGEGSVFRLWAPIVNSNTESQSAISRQLPLLTDTEILVVDDDFRVRRAVAQMLEVARAKVTTAGTVDEALALLLKQRFDAVCTDAIMPGRPTRELIEALDVNYPGTAVLVCSAYVEEDLLKRGIASGKIPYLTKPFSQERLIRKLNTLLKAKRLSFAPAAAN